MLDRRNPRFKKMANKIRSCGSSIEADNSYCKNSYFFLFVFFLFLINLIKQMLESRGTRKFGSNSSSIGSSTLSLDPLSGCLEGVDPLSQFSRESDPLSQMAAEYVSIIAGLS